MPTNPLIDRNARLDTSTTAIARTAAYNMPFAGHLLSRTSNLTGGELADWLEAVTTELHRLHAEREEAREQLVELERQRASVRAFFGTDQLGGRA